MAKSRRDSNGKKLATQQSVDAAVWSICDVMRRGNVASAIQYVPELTWILFLRILDETETEEAEEAEAVGRHNASSLAEPYRWQDWAAPNGSTRLALQFGAAGGLFNFANSDLIPYLKSL